MLRHLAVACSLLLSAITALAQEPIDIHLTHLPDAQGWRVRYVLTQPAQQLRYRQSFGDRRSTTWRVVTPNLHIVATPEGEVLEARDHSTFREAIVEFASDQTKLPANYPLNEQFSDGSEWIYVGHLYADRIRDGREAPLLPKLTLVPRENERILLLGRSHEGTTHWTDDDPEREGTFVYFGNLPALETEHVVAIIEPRLPAYLRSAIDDALPKLTHIFTRKLEVTRRTKPQISIGFDPAETSSGGDVIRGAVGFYFNGPRWAQSSDATLTQAMLTIAHEAAHLWNGEEYESAENSTAPWLHEGSADALAWLALRELNFFDDAAVLRQVDSALNQCAGMNGLGTTALDKAISQGRYDLAYSCGATMNMLAHFALRERGGLFELWKQVFKDAAARDKRYDSAMFFAALAKLGAPEKLADTLRTLSSAGSSDPLDLLSSRFAELGLKPMPADPPRSAWPEYSKHAMFELMAADCGHVSFNFFDDRFVLFGSEDCKHLSRELTVTSMADEPLLDNGLAVYRAVADRCRQRAPVKLGIEATEGGGDHIDLPCAQDLPPVRYVSLRVE